MTKSFATVFRWIFTQNWILDPEIGSTQRVQQNAHLIDQKRQQKYRHPLFFKNRMKSKIGHFGRIFGISRALNNSI